MIQIFDEKIEISGPYHGVFGEYDRVLTGDLNEDEYSILNDSYPSIEVLSCKLQNISRDKLEINKYYLLEFENEQIQTWHYEGISKIDNSYCVFNRPKLK